MSDLDVRIVKLEPMRVLTSPMLPGGQPVTERRSWLEIDSIRWLVTRTNRSRAPTSAGATRSGGSSEPTWRTQALPPASALEPGYG